MAKDGGGGEEKEQIKKFVSPPLFGPGRALARPPLFLIYFPHFDVNFSSSPPPSTLFLLSPEK